jgi:hypothetical protein
MRRSCCPILKTVLIHPRKRRIGRSTSSAPEQAAGWRQRDWKLAIPDLMFPADRSWLLSTLWDDDWTCVGGPEPLVSSLLSHPLLGGRTRRVGVDEDATPPGHESR